MSNGTTVHLEAIEKTFRTRQFLGVDEESGQRRVLLKKTVHAARSITFGIRAGEIFGLLGPNGAGKTTTVKMISGLVRPDRGTVRIDGLDVEKHRKRILRKIGVVLEGTRTSMWPLTPLENLTYYGNMKGVSGRTLKQRAHALIDFIGLADKKHVQVRYLSRGQKQKLAICIALIADPQVLLLDEPTTGLDVQSARAIKDKVIEMAHEQGKCVLVTTHDMHVAQELCDTIGIIDGGALIACKPTPALLDIFSGHVFVFRLDRLPPETLFDHIDGLTDLELEMTTDGPQAVVRVTADLDRRSDALYGVVGRLREAGYRLRGITQRQQNLESVFLELTSKKKGR